MKRFILSCVLFLGGLLSAVGWVIACATLANGAYSAVTVCIHDSLDWGIILFFLTVAVLGLIFAIRDIKEERR